MLFGLSKVPSHAGSVSINIQKSSLDGQMPRTCLQRYD